MLGKSCSKLQLQHAASKFRHLYLGRCATSCSIRIYQLHVETLDVQHLHRIISKSAYHILLGRGHYQGDESARVEVRVANRHITFWVPYLEYRVVWAKSDNAGLHP